uniref:Uncharacterized protein n=1 Tax=Anopheles epiroticus TaxID=199890 RepID=A0A182PX28_9DIPT
MSNFLRMLKLPSEISRKMRGLNLLQIWKASEFQSFLLYASVEVLKGRINVKCKLAAIPKTITKDNSKKMENQFYKFIPASSTFKTT